MVMLKLLENKEDRLEALDTPIFKALSKVIGEENLDAYVIGGFVRDLLLDRPCKDIDVVVVGSGIDLAQKVAQELGDLKVNVFKNFGTAQFRHKEWEVEFVGARKESYSRESRKPIVEDGTLQDDQNRRDFTINALALSLHPDTFGDFIDPFNGLEDLKNGIIKTPLNPDITYSDDPLRMMRAIRFATQLNFTIEEESFNSLQKNKDRIKIISRERVADELNKIMLSKKPSIGWIILHKVELLPIIFPEFAALHGIEVKNNVRHKDNFFHTVQVVDKMALRSEDLWMRWAALMHDIGKPLSKRFSDTEGWTFHGHEERGGRMVPKIFRRLKLPLDHKMKFVQKLVSLHHRPVAVTNERVTDSAVRRLIFDAGEDLDSLITLCECDITTKNRLKLVKYLENFKELREKIEEVEERDRIRMWQPPIDGQEIIETFGLKPCKEIGIIKNTIKEAILDGVIPNEKEKAIELMLEEGKRLGLTAVKNIEDGKL